MLLLRVLPLLCHCAVFFTIGVGCSDGAWDASFVVPRIFKADFSAGAGQLSARGPHPPPPVATSTLLPANATRPTVVFRVAKHVQKHIVPQLPRPWLVSIACVAGAELAKREAVAQVETRLPQQLQPEALQLLDDTYLHLQQRVAELQASNWDWKTAATREAAAWRHRSAVASKGLFASVGSRPAAGAGSGAGAGVLPATVDEDDVYARWERLLRAALEVQASNVVRDWSGGSIAAEDLEFFSLMPQMQTDKLFESTMRQLEESVGRLVPADTRAQLSRIEALVRQLDRPGGLGELGVAELYEVFSGGSPPPQAVMDIARLLSITDATAYSLGSLEAAGERQITLASLLLKLTSPTDMTRALVYAALAAEGEAVESLRALNEGLQAQISRTLADTEADLLQQASGTLRQPPKPPASVATLITSSSSSAVAAAAVTSAAAASAAAEDTYEQDGGPLAKFNYPASVAATAVRATREWFAETAEGVNGALEEMMEPTRRGLPHPGQLLPWQRWYQTAWNSVAWSSSPAALGDTADEGENVAATAATMEDLGGGERAGNNRSRNGPGGPRDRIGPM